MIIIIAKEINSSRTVSAGELPYSKTGIFHYELPDLENFLREARAKDYGSADIIGWGLVPEEGKKGGGV